MKIAVIGSRNFNDFNLLSSALNTLEPSEVVSGGAKGADSLAELFAEKHNIKKTVFLPKFKTDPAVKYHPKWFHVRNKEIVEYADLVLAFWDGKSKGTLNTINQAKKLKKPLQIIHFPNNTKPVQNKKC